jgi:hypothetical protein
MSSVFCFFMCPAKKISRHNYSLSPIRVRTYNSLKITKRDLISVIASAVEFMHCFQHSHNILNRRVCLDIVNCIEDKTSAF